MLWKRPIPALFFDTWSKKWHECTDLYATFMPKSLNAQNGSGMHVHQSLWKNGKNIFFSENDPFHLSETAYQYISGLMIQAQEMSAVLNQWINSFKRLIEGYEAPVYRAWGQKNRSAYIRVPEYQPGIEKSTRIELRSPDPSCNLYLTMAVMFSAGIEGIKKKYKAINSVEENIYHMSSTRQKEQ